MLPGRRRGLELVTGVLEGGGPEQRPRRKGKREKIARPAIRYSFRHQEKVRLIVLRGKKGKREGTAIFILEKKKDSFLLGAPQRERE